MKQLALTDKERELLVAYRIERAKSTLAEADEFIAAIEKEVAS